MNRKLQSDFVSHLRDSSPNGVAQAALLATSTTSFEVWILFRWDIVVNLWLWI